MGRGRRRDDDKETVPIPGDIHTTDMGLLVR